MEKQISLQMKPRTVRGKKVRFLRREGQIPANIYGPGMNSIAVQVDEKELRRVLRAAGMHRLMHLTVGAKKKKTHQVLVRQVQQDSITDAILHVDFYQVPLDKKFISQVPLMLQGEAPAVSSGGILLRILDHVTIESLPQDLPAVLEVNVSTLESFDDALWVRDLVVPANVKILTDGDELIAKIQRPRILEEEVVEAEEEALAAEETAAPTEDEDSTPSYTR